jgi:hypothetical protein
MMKVVSNPDVISRRRCLRTAHQRTNAGTIFKTPWQPR